MGVSRSIGVLVVFLSGLAWPVQLAIVLVYFLISWWLCNRLIEQLEIKDEPQIVADEVAGMWLALVWLPQSVGWCLAAFVCSVWRTF